MIRQPGLKNEVFFDSIDVFESVVLALLNHQFHSWNIGCGKKVSRNHCSQFNVMPACDQRIERVDFTEFSGDIKCRIRLFEKINRIAAWRPGLADLNVDSRFKFFELEFHLFIF